MAHRVVAQWFVRCRIQYRPAMARFISKVHITPSHLHTITYPHPHILKYMCTFLPPSQKLSVYAGSISVGREGEGGEEVGEELVEVCEDMMARFTYSNLSTLPSR